MAIKKLKALRKELHRHPELSGQEVETAMRIKKFIQEHDNPEIIDGLGGNGLAVVYRFSDSGPVVVIRCELDALPIEEENNFEYRSINGGVSHKCGHDGHMAILSGLALWLKDQKFHYGKVVLLFQPAEETGTGAADVLKDSRFRDLKPDHVFALHNVPGFPLNAIVCIEDNFSSTVQSVSIQLVGKESHSAQPEHGLNPALCIAELIQRFDALNNNNPAGSDFRLMVPIYSTMGKKSYGISAGSGEIHYTLRTKSKVEMESLKSEVEAIILEIGSKHRLLHSAIWFDYFPAVINDDFCNQMIAQAAKRSGFDVIDKEQAFKFGEDFGWFSESYKGAMFGLGSGIQSPTLHQANYDFPEEILETGMTMFENIIVLLLQDQIK